MVLRRDTGLVFGGRRTPRRADFAVRPCLLRDPVERVVAVGARRPEDVVIAFREEVSALVLHDIRITALDGGDRRGHIRRHAVAHVPEIEVVGRLDEDGPDFAARVFRAVDVGREPHPVAHRHHHLALDDGNRLQFVLEVETPLRLLGCHRLTPLRDDHGRRGGKRYDEGDDSAIEHGRDYKGPR